MTFIGIDPGVTGAIAVMDGKTAAVHDIPTFQVQRGKRKRREYNAIALVTTIGPYAARYWVGNNAMTDEPCARVIIEDVHARPIEGRHASPAAIEQMVACGYIVEGICAALGIPFERVQPQVWKRAHGLGSDKEHARKLATQMFPSLASELARKQDHNRADALFIARYAQRRDEKGGA